MQLSNASDLSFLSCELRILELTGVCLPSLTFLGSRPFSSLVELSIVRVSIRDFAIIESLTELRVLRIRYCLIRPHDPLLLERFSLRLRILDLQCSRLERFPIAALVCFQRYTRLEHINLGGFLMNGLLIRYDVAVVGLSGLTHIKVTTLCDEESTFLTFNSERMQPARALPQPLHSRLEYLCVGVDARSSECFQTIGQLTKLRELCIRMLVAALEHTLLHVIGPTVHKLHVEAVQPDLNEPRLSLVQEFDTDQTSRCTTNIRVLTLPRFRVQAHHDTVPELSRRAQFPPVVRTQRRNPCGASRRTAPTCQVELGGRC